MHVLTGILGFAAVLFATVALQRSDGGFAGFFYPPAMLLIGSVTLSFAILRSRRGFR